MKECFAFGDKVVLRVSFNDGEVYRLCSCSPVDASIYGKDGLWTGTIVEPVSPARPKNLRSGGGMDFLETDIVEVFNEQSKSVIFSTQTNKAT